jgi:hypothetical protein
VCFFETGEVVTLGAETFHGLTTSRSCERIHRSKGGADLVIRQLVELREQRFGNVKASDLSRVLTHPRAHAFEDAAVRFAVR